MSINLKKNSRCLRVWQRFNAKCTWANEIKYLGIRVISSKAFKCILHEAKRSFYRSANEIFFKIGRFVPEHVKLQFVQANVCQPYCMVLKPVT